MMGIDWRDKRTAANWRPMFRTERQELSKSKSTYAELCREKIEDKPVGEVAREARTLYVRHKPCCGQTAHAETQTATDTVSDNKGRL